MSDAEGGEMHSNFGHCRFGDGWWWGVWQGTRLVGFGAGYRRKARCFSHQRSCERLAAEVEMPKVMCENPRVTPAEWWFKKLEAFKAKGKTDG